MRSDYDLLIIGGGINGCGIARDAAGRGLNVCLSEMNDLGSATSASSTKLFHGGLRYLDAAHLVAYAFRFALPPEHAVRHVDTDVEAVGRAYALDERPSTCMADPLGSVHV